MHRIRSIISPIKNMVFPTNKKSHKIYTRYISWSFFSNIIVSVENALVTDSMLHAIDIDVCTENSAVRTMNYIGKDIIGQLGSLGYIAKFGNNIDKTPRQILLYSNITQQTSMMITALTPFISKWFLPIAGFSSILSNISFIGFGAINAKCIQHISKDTDNIGEIYAKISVINTFGSSIGLLIGIYISFVIPDHSTRLAIIPFLTFLRIFTFNRSISGIIA